MAKKSLLLSPSVTSQNFLLMYIISLKRKTMIKRILVALAKTGMVCYDYSAKKVAAVPKEAKDKLE